MAKKRNPSQFNSDIRCDSLDSFPHIWHFFGGNLRKNGVALFSLASLMGNAAEGSTGKRLSQTKRSGRMKLCMQWGWCEKWTSAFEGLCDPKGGPFRCRSLLYVTIFPPRVIFYQMWSFRWGQSDTKIFESPEISLDHGRVKHFQPQHCFSKAGGTDTAAARFTNYATTHVRKWTFPEKK